MRFKAMTFISIFLSVSIPHTANADLGTLSLTGKCERCNLSNAKYNMANFSKKKFICSNFNNSSFESADLSNGTLVGSFEKVNFRGANLSKVNLTPTTTIDCDLPRADVSNFLSQNKYLNRLRAVNIGNHQITFNNNDLRGANLSGMNVIGNNSYPEKAVFLNTKLDGVKALNITDQVGMFFINSDAKRSNFSNLRNSKNSRYVRFYIVTSNWAGANLSKVESSIYAFGSKLDKVNFSNSKISWLYDSSAPNSNFMGSNLSKANISNSTFDGSNFQSANLSGATLTNSSFSNSDFSNSNLSGADLRGADMSGVNFEGANLEDVKLENTNLCEAISPTGDLLFIGC